MTVQRLALGTAQLGQRYGITNRLGQPAWEEARGIVHHAQVAGIDTVDTAIGYGDSEEILGRIGVDGLRIVTKLPAVPREESDVSRWVRTQVAKSLARLRCGRLYALMLHHPADAMGARGEGLLKVLIELKAEGLVQKVGPSIYSPAELDSLAQSMPLDIVQAPYNVLDRRLQNSGWLERLRRSGAEIHTRSAFLQGLLLLDPPDLPSAFQRWATLWARWSDWRRAHCLSPLEASLGFVLRNPGIDRVVVGVETVSQWREIAAGARSLECDVPDDFACSELELIDPSRWRAA